MSMNIFYPSNPLDFLWWQRLDQKRPFEETEFYMTFIWNFPDTIVLSRMISWIKIGDSSSPPTRSCLPSCFLICQIMSSLWCIYVQIRCLLQIMVRFGFLWCQTDHRMCGYLRIFFSGDFFLLNHLIGTSSLMVPLSLLKSTMDLSHQV